MIAFSRIHKPINPKSIKIPNTNQIIYKNKNPDHNFQKQKENPKKIKAFAVEFFTPGGH